MRSPQGEHNPAGTKGMAEAKSRGEREGNAQPAGRAQSRLSHHLTQNRAANGLELHKLVFADELCAINDTFLHKVVPQEKFCTNSGIFLYKVALELDLHNLPDKPSCAFQTKINSHICELRKVSLLLCHSREDFMVVIFDKEYLRELYEFGKTSDKKHRFQPDIVKRYIKCVKFLIASDSVEILKQINSLNYEVLKGDKEGISSIRVNNKYRLEFLVREYREESIITICNILELSNHYQ